MRDTDIGKLELEQMNLEPFLDAFPLITGRNLEIIDRSESPDFEAMIDGVAMGIELTEIRADDPDDYLSEVFRLADKKATSYRRAGVFEARPVMLLCHSGAMPFFDVRREMERQAFWEDYEQLGFAEIWLMDLSDAYYSAQDPRRPADLFGLAPEDWRGFHRAGMGDRKPYG